MGSGAASVHTRTMEWKLRHPGTPTRDHPDQALQFLDLTTACHRFASSIQQALPRLHDRQLTADQLTAVYMVVANARAALDQLESAMDTCDIELHAAPINLLEPVMEHRRRSGTDRWNVPG